METFKPRTRSEKLLLQELPDEVLIYDLERNEVHCLNGSAARVWALCDGERTVAEIAQLVAPDLEGATGESLVWCALDQFTARHLLEEATDELEDVDRPAELTRREMVVGLGLLVGLAVPVVESIVSPPAALAQSGCSGSTVSMGATPC